MNNYVRYCPALTNHNNRELRSKLSIINEESTNYVISDHRNIVLYVLQQHVIVVSNNEIATKYKGIQCDNTFLLCQLVRLNRITLFEGQMEATDERSSLNCVDTQ